MKMKTQIVDCTKEIDENKLKECGELLRQGKIGIFPTETVYGVGADALNETAAMNIFKAKGRANDNPLIVHIADFDMLEDLVETPNEMEQKLIDAFFPGPFTLILKRKEKVPNVVTAGLDTVGIRMPENEIAHKLITYAKRPICAPSANLSSRPSGTKLEDIQDEFDGKVAFMIDGGMTAIGVESTVCKVIDGIPTILRPGKITPQDIEAVVGVCRLDSHLFQKATGKVESPGMKYKHYAPKAEALMVYSDDEDTMIQLIKEHVTANTAIIGFAEHKKFFPDQLYYSYGHIGHLDEVMHNIFTLLRQVDRQKPDFIIIEGVKKEGLGIAIMNRLIRSVSYHYIEK